MNLYNVERTRLPHLPAEALEQRRAAAKARASKRDAAASPEQAAAEIRQRIFSLPPLPSPVGTLLRLVNDPDVEFKQIARTISMDETLTAQLLRIANSAFYGFPQQIRTVQQATVIVGRQAVRNLALSLAMVKVRSHMKVNGPLSPEDFWRHSMAVAYGARMLTQHQRSVSADEAFVAGLLHDVGKVVFVDYDPDTYEELLRTAQDGGEPLHLLERERFGIDHAEVGQLLCQHWSFPDILGAAVAVHHGAAEAADENALRITDILNVADALAKISRIGDGGNPHVAADWLSGSPTFAGMPDRIRQTFNDLGEEVAANQQMFLDRPTVPVHPNGRGEKKHAVHVAIAAVDLRTMVEFASRAQKCDVVGPGEIEVDLIVADASLSAPERSAFAARGVPIADVAEWQQTQPSRDWINVHQLHRWLSDSFRPLSPAA